MQVLLYQQQVTDYFSQQYFYMISISLYDVSETRVQYIILVITTLKRTLLWKHSTKFIYKRGIKVWLVGGLIGEIKISGVLRYVLTIIIFKKTREHTPK